MEANLGQNLRYHLSVIIWQRTNLQTRLIIMRAHFIQIYHGRVSLQNFSVKPETTMPLSKLSLWNHIPIWYNIYLKFSSKHLGIFTLMKFWRFVLHISLAAHSGSSTTLPAGRSSDSWLGSRKPKRKVKKSNPCIKIKSTPSISIIPHILITHYILRTKLRNANVRLTWYASLWRQNVFNTEIARSKTFPQLLRTHSAPFHLSPLNTTKYLQSIIFFLPPQKAHNPLQSKSSTLTIYPPLLKQKRINHHQQPVNIMVVHGDAKVNIKNYNILINSHNTTH